MKKMFITLSLFVIGISQSAFAETETLLVSVNKSVPLARAQEFADLLNRPNMTTGTCYFQARSNYIPYKSCENDATCPYWGVAIVDVEVTCKEELPAAKNFIKSIETDPNYKIYSNGKIGAFPILSGSTQ